MLRQNILLDIEGKPRAPFHYLDKGIMAIIGNNSGVAEVGEHRLQIHGAIAFAAWREYTQPCFPQPAQESKPLWNGPGIILEGPAAMTILTAEQSCEST